MLNDDRLLPEAEKQLDEMKALREKGEIGEYRPELNGYTRQAKEMLLLRVEIVHLRRMMSRNMSIPIPKEPVFPAERIDSLRTQREGDDLLADVCAMLLKQQSRRQPGVKTTDGHL